MLSSHADMSAVLFPGLSSCLDASLDKRLELLRALPSPPGRRPLCGKATVKHGVLA